MNIYDKYLIPQVLLTSDYYKEQLTLMLRNSFGVPQQVELFTDILNVFHTRTLDIFNLLGKYDENSKKWKAINLEAIKTIDKTNSFLLDYIAEIVGCSRYYSFLKTPLNNTELYILIYFKILQNNFLGTNEEILRIYDTIFADTEYSDFKIEYYPSVENVASCTVALDMTNIVDSEGNVLDEYKNLYELYNHDLLEVKSVGITYKKLYEIQGAMGFFDKYPESISEDGSTINYVSDSDHCKWDTAYFS